MQVLEIHVQNKSPAETKLSLSVFVRFKKSIQLVVTAQPTVWLYNRLKPNQSTASSPR